MKRLGYTRYVAQGGDWGAFVVDQMGLQAPAGLLAHPHQHACHRSSRRRQGCSGSAPRRQPVSRPRNSAPTSSSLELSSKSTTHRMMASRPQTLYGIADSPVGLAAWLLDHNDADGQPAAAVAAALDRTASATGELTRDEILDNITLYWLTNTGVSSSRLYWEYKGGFFNAKGVSIPVAVSVFPGEQYRSPAELDRAGVSQTHPLQQARQRRPLRGLGAAAIFAAELRAAFRSLRQASRSERRARVSTPRNPPQMHRAQEEIMSKSLSSARRSVLASLCGEHSVPSASLD